MDTTSPPFGIYQPATACRFRINFLNDEMNMSLCPAIIGAEVDFFKRVLEVNFDLIITGTLFCKQLNTILEDIRVEGYHSPTESGSILIEYLSGRSSEALPLGSLLLEDANMAEGGGLKILHDYANTGTQKFNLKFHFSKATFLSQEMLRARGLIDE